MNFFVRQPNSEEIEKFKKALNTWNENKSGNLVKGLANQIQIKNSRCCDVYHISYNTLTENRRSVPTKDPSPRLQLADVPTVAHGSLNVWTRPTPTTLVSDFKETEFGEEIQGTEYYAGCKDCAEKGYNDCGTCNQSGKLICGDCGGNRILDCPSCNGYGEFKCSDCHQGFVEVDCSVCRGNGKVSCSACGGEGLKHWGGDSKATPCAHCQNGKIRCTACNGKTTETVACGKCSGGRVPCGTCRSQKKIQCPSCDIRGHVNCHSCSGTAKLDCRPCNKKGGFRHVENIVYTTTIQTNEVTVTAIEKILDKIRLSLQEVSAVVHPKILSDHFSNLIPSQELVGPIQQLYTHVSENRPKTTALEKLQIKKGSVLDIDFIFDGQPGHAFYDPIGGLVLVDKNPLENKINDAKNQLKKRYDEAKAKQNIPLCRSIIQQAEQLKIQDYVHQWKNEIDALEKKLIAIESAHFISNFRTPGFILLAPGLWFIAGFFTPMSITQLLIFSWFSFREYSVASKDLTLGKKRLGLSFVKQAQKLALIVFAFVLLSFTFSWLSTNSAVEKVFQYGAPLVKDNL